MDGTEAMNPSRCKHCGSVDVPWLTGHAPTCPSYRPPSSCRVCPACTYPMAVTNIEFGEHTEVTFTCKRGCDVAWTESTEPDPTEPEENAS